MNYTDYVIDLDNALTLLRLKMYHSQLTAPEATLLDTEIYRLIRKIDKDLGEPGFDTDAAFEEFFDRPIF